MSFDEIIAMFQKVADNHAALVDTINSYKQNVEALAKGMETFTNQSSDPTIVTTPSTNIVPVQPFRSSK